MTRPNLNAVHDFSVEQPETGQGISLHDLADGTVVEIETQHHQYRLVKQADSHVSISGHPTFCSEPVEMEVEGSTGRGAPPTPNPGFIGRGMYLVLKHPVFNRITTSRIRDIRVLG